MKYILVTGGVTSGIGKGCLSAILGRCLNLSGLKVNYQKFEPCLQGSIISLPNTNFGEIIVENNDIYYDSDVARAKFFIPNFKPKQHSDISLGTILKNAITSKKFNENHSPKISEVSEFINNQLIDNQNVINIVEIGGTAGEIEHNLFLNLLKRAIGKPYIHVHLTICLTTIDNIKITKPAQISINSLEIDPDIIFVRNSSEYELDTFFREYGKSYHIIPVDNDAYFPERAYYKSICSSLIKNYIENMFNISLKRDEIFETYSTPHKKIAIIHDGAGKSGYQSLINRLIVWSKSMIIFDMFEYSSNISNEYDGIIFIGEEVINIEDSFFPKNIPMLNITFKKNDNFRNIELRYDWMGRADKPYGNLYDYIINVIEGVNKTIVD